MSRDTSFYYAFLVLPPRQRHAIITVWDFCRAVDDAVDEPGGEDPRSERGRQHARAALDRWSAELAAAFGNGSPSTVQGRALVEVVRQFELTIEPFQQVIEGVRMDLRHRRYETYDELTQYCLRVASAVGLICVEIFGCRTASARAYAIDLGLALQLTNIVRDVAADYALDRVYLPRQDLARFGASEQDIAERRLTPALRDVLALQCARARTHFDRAAAALRSSERRPLLAAEGMGAIYRELLTRIERNGYDVFSSTVRVPRVRRAWIAARTCLQLLAPSFRRERALPLSTPRDS